ncbi:MAG: ADP-dependent glucokinase/phosphofructokinase [Lachnospiraceae bacterium]
MAYQDKYQSYLEQVPQYIQYCQNANKRVVFGYTSDLDMILKWDVNKFNKILAEHLQESPYCEEGDVIDSLESFAKIISYYAIRGAGGEIDITNWDVCEYLRKEFYSEYALGGTCAQGAAAFAAVGFPLIAHITDRSKPVCEFLDYPGLDMIKGDARMPMKACATKELPVLHIIFQFEKGDIVKALGKEYVIPLSNRVIIDYDTIHKKLPIDEEFLEYCEKHAEELVSYNVSGFNAILDFELLEKKMEYLRKHYLHVKTRNPNCCIYLEGAHYLSAKSKSLVFEKMSSCVDILGMNEEEMEDMAQREGIPVDKERLDSVLDVLERIINLYGCKGIVMHTKDYSMYIGEEMQGVNVEMGLTLGNLMSCTRARMGKYGTLEECAQSLKEPLSPTGVRFAKELESKSTTYMTCLVPSRYLEKPRYTIGLGDTFVAGMQVGLIRKDDC